MKEILKDSQYNCSLWVNIFCLTIKYIFVGTYTVNGYDICIYRDWVVLYKIDIVFCISVTTSVNQITEGKCNKYTHFY